MNTVWWSQKAKIPKPKPEKVHQPKIRELKYEKGNNNNINNSKEGNVAAGVSPSRWKFLTPMCIINITEFLERPKSYDQVRRWAVGRPPGITVG